MLWLSQSQSVRNGVPNGLPVRVKAVLEDVERWGVYDGGRQSIPVVDSADRERVVSHPTRGLRLVELKRVSSCRAACVWSEKLTWVNIDIPSQHLIQVDHVAASALIVEGRQLQDTEPLLVPTLK